MRYRLAALTTALALALSIVGASNPGLTQEKDGARGPRGQGQVPPMRAAMRNLEQAGRQLQKAEHDYGGHRTKALELVKQAQQEIKAAMEYARENPPTPGASGTTTPPAKTQ